MASPCWRPTRRLTMSLRLLCLLWRKRWLRLRLRLLRQLEFEFDLEPQWLKSSPRGPWWWRQTRVRRHRFSCHCHRLFSGGGGNRNGRCGQNWILCAVSSTQRLTRSQPWNEFEKMRVVMCWFWTTWFDYLQQSKCLFFGI